MHSVINSSTHTTKCRGDNRFNSKTTRKIKIENIFIRHKTIKSLCNNSSFHNLIKSIHFERHKTSLSIISPPPPPREILNKPMIKYYGLFVFAIISYE